MYNNYKNALISMFKKGGSFIKAVVVDTTKALVTDIKQNRADKKEFLEFQKAKHGIQDTSNQ